MKNNNKLIAEFMDYPTCAEYWKGTSMVNWEHEDYKDYYYVDGKYNHMDGSNFHVSDMRFDTSWDWLMSVANEIIKSRDEQNADWDLTDLKYALCTTNIKLVYKAVVNFIKDYNNGKN